jgi:hypothetical protein
VVETAQSYRRDRTLGALSRSLPTAIVLRDAGGSCDRGWMSSRASGGCARGERGRDVREPELDFRRDLRRSRAIAIAVFACAAFASGLASVHSSPAPLIFGAMLLASSSVTACVADAYSRGTCVPHSLRWVAFWTWMLAVPVYLVWSRGRKGVLFAIAFSAAAYALGIVGAAVGFSIR